MAIKGSTKSLHEFASDALGNFFFEEGFPKVDGFHDGLLDLINKIGSYQEEGERLYPELLVTGAFDELVKQIPDNHVIEIETSFASKQAFAKAIKSCAPLARNGWVIFLALKDGKVRYGLLSAQNSPLSPSIYRHLFGDVAGEMLPGPLAYVRRVAPHVVEVSGSKSRLKLSFAVTRTDDTELDHVSVLANATSRDLEDKTRDTCASFMRQVFEDALREGHGSLVAVVDDEAVAIAAVRTFLPDAAFLPTPVDVAVLLPEFHRLGAIATVIKGMVCQDGVTIMTTKARVLAFRAIVPNVTDAHKDEAGGTRTRAYEAMKKKGIFRCCLFRSQDGRQEVWSAQDE